MSVSKKRPAVIVTIVVVILIGLFFVLRHFGIYFRSPIVLLPDPQQVSTADRKSTSSSQDAAAYGTLREVSGAGATDSISRDQALERYAGNVIQLDANCRAEPVTKVIPQKTILMFDNESQWSRTVIVGPRTYVIAPFDYVLAVFNVPGTFAVTCDSVQAVALIAVQ
jgi:hypothetical protein